MAFSLRSRLKKGFKRKKHEKPEIKIDKITIDKIQKLKQQISLDPEKDHLLDFSRIVRYFFMKLLKIRYHFRPLIDYEVDRYQV